jgi:hypothetical protein
MSRNCVPYGISFVAEEIIPTFNPLNSSSVIPCSFIQQKLPGPRGVQFW